jgi:predicted RNase H-like HicB family nuclease
MIDNILSGYINAAMAYAEYDKLEDGSFCGKIKKCTGIVAFGKTLRKCENELQSVLEDWILTGLKFNHQLTVIDNYTLNRINL